MLVCDGTTISQPNVSYNKKNYQFNDGDLLVFRVYYEGGNTDAIQIMFNWSEGQRIGKRRIYDCENALFREYRKQTAFVCEQLG